MLTYSMDNRKNMSKTMYLYKCIRQDIETGMIKKGEKLPSKRSLSNHLSISVITIENAYSMLLDEGYIESRPKSGYYVSSSVITKSEPETNFQLLDEKEEYYQESSSFFPAFSKIMRRIISEKPEILSAKQPSGGCACLRNEISTFLKRYRNMNVNPNNVIVGSGAEYLYNLLVYLFSDKTIAIENPSYEKIFKVYELNGVKTTQLNLGKDGILSSELDNCTANVLHVSPFHSFPSGVTTSASKRLEYVEWAEKNNSYIVEDDFDSEFVYNKKPLNTLFSLDKNDKVIYLNTFSKSISPSIRVGYMILPDTLMRVYEKKLAFLACTVPVFDQYVLAEFIRNGGFERLLNIKRRDNDLSRQENVVN